MITLFVFLLLSISTLTSFAQTRNDSINYLSVTSILNKNDYSLSVEFSMPVKNIDNQHNYIIETDLTYPVSAVVANNDNTLVNLLFENKLPDNQIITLCIENICSQNNLLMNDTCCKILIHHVDYLDVIIDEVMFDVNPLPENLPPYDYIELFNRSKADIDISGWALSLSDKIFTIPPATSIYSDDYLIISSTQFAKEAPNISNIAAISSFTIKNNDDISLYDNNMNLIHYIDFSVDWFSNSDFNDGGWSLEMINTNLPCLSSDNWDGSINPNGGTPGTENSISSLETTDNQPPYITDIQVNTESTLLIYFSEIVLLDDALDLTNYSIKPYINIDAINFLNNNHNSIVVDLSDIINIGEIYTLYVSSPIADCNNNKTTCSYKFGIGYTPSFQDIVINEILFNASDNNNDYVEILNNSDKVVQLNDLKLGHGNNTETIKYTEYLPKRLLSPGDIVLLTSDTVGLTNTYPKNNPDAFIIVEDFPALYNDNGYLCLSNSDNQLVEWCYYSSNMHINYLSEQKDVSLERISSTHLSEDITNWHSAAETYNYGSPGVKNSQSLDSNKIDDTELDLLIKPIIITPNNDGDNDITVINYSLGENGVLASCYIYTRNGIMIRRLLDNTAIEVNGSVVWDAVDDKGCIVKPGTYIVVMTVASESGHITKKKGIVVVL